MAKLILNPTLPSREELPPVIIGMHGKARSGKDTFATLLHSYLWEPGKEAERTAFASPLKLGVEEIFGLTPTNDINKEQVHPFWGVTRRQLLQYVGTEMFREHFGEDFWNWAMLASLKEIKDSLGTTYAIITDVRFQNEVDLILRLGGTIIHLTRPESPAIMGLQNHRSEAECILPDSPQVIKVDNSGSLYELKRKAIAVAQEIKNASSS
jgi:hypothetical protein